MRRRHSIMLLFVATLLAPLAGWSLGDPEAGSYQPVQGLENWDARIDLSAYKAGKYNLVVRATDQAGNVRYGGPYNVFVDPASDLPVVHVSHPAPSVRVSTILHVVGTCIDDDGVKAVRVQLDDREPATAEGTDLWSWTADVSSVPDGIHALTVTATDVNGVESKPQTVRFNIDKKAPVVRITSHASGAIVAGRIALEGQVTDPNGVASLALSRDGGATYEPIKIGVDKSGLQAGFRIDLDTKAIADGPLVLSFRSIDRTGSVGRFAFLLFVNNVAPALEVISPAEGSAVNGKVLVVGRASDMIGLKSLTWELSSGESGSVELVAGNQFWTQVLDLSSKKAGPVQVTYTLENLTGNRLSRRLKLAVDPEADRPILKVVSPEQGGQATGPLVVAGFVSDDDGVERIEWSLDGTAQTPVAARSAFAFSLDDVAAGQHRLKLSAVDTGGAASLPIEVAFTKAGTAPVISLETLVTAAGSEPFAPGAVFIPEKDGRLSGTVRFSPGTLRAEYSLAGAALQTLTLKKAATEDQRGFDIVLPKGLVAGRVDILIKAADAFGGVSEYKSFFFSGPEQGPPTIILADGRLAADGTIRLDERPLTGYVTGGPVQDVVLDPPTDLVRVEVEGQIIRVSASGSGTSAPTRLRVTAADGSTLASDPLRFITDATPPTLEVTLPRFDDWLKSDLRLEGSVSDPGGSVVLEYSLDSGSFVPVETKAEGSGRTFASTVPIIDLGKVEHLLVLRATDAAGNATVVPVAFHTDVIAPTLSLVAPRAEDEVNGLVTLVGRLDDDGLIGLVEASEDGSTFQEISRGPQFRWDVNLSTIANPDSLVLRGTDAAGNTVESRPRLALDLEADQPVAQVQVPADGELLRDDFVLSGMVFDDDGVRSVSYRIDGGEFQSLPGGNNFSVPISLDQVTDNEHVVEVKAEDIGGLASAVASARFKVSRSDPVSTLTSPHISDHLSGVVELKGTSTDPNGIAEVRVSFDNGLSFNRVEGTATWRYRLDTRLLADGIQAVLVKATDTTGAEGLYTTTINIDNHPPELVIDAPADGQVFNDILRLDGRSVDTIGVSGLAVSIAPIGASTQETRSVEVALTPGGVLAKDIDITALPTGWYNLQIEAVDRAGNRSYVARNFLRRPVAEAERVDLLFPSEGERLAGPFAISGQVVTRVATEGKNVVILADGQPLATAPLDDQGYFSLDVDPESLAAGDHRFTVEAALLEGSRLVSEPRAIQYAKFGPWVRIASFTTGSYVTGRPWLQGTAGWLADAAAEAAAVPAEGARAPKHPERKVKLVEVSMDNGKSFVKADGTESWRYRLEAQQIPNGALRLLVKATFASGETAMTRTQLTVDTRVPEVALREPKEGERFNEAVQIMGSAADESGLAEVAVSLREGDKSRYQVPSFIQGLYLDAHTMGATYWDAGLGLTFLDDNIKLQVQLGMAPPGRFSGLVLGAKLLANIATLPFGWMLGPDWDFFSMALAVGANFSYFTMSEDTIAFTDAGLVLGAIVAQLEFAKFDIAAWRMLNTWSLYTEYQLWFISSDVEGGTASKLSFGLRIGLL